jgi:hypothetical protein
VVFEVLHDNHIHTTTHGAHIHFQTIILYGCNFTDIYNINMLWMILFCTKFCGQMKCVLHVSVSSMYISSHIWVQDNPHTGRELGYQVCFSANICAVIIWAIVMGPYLLADRRTAHSFLETLLSGLLADNINMLCYGWSCFAQNSVVGWSVFYMWVWVQCTYQVTSGCRIILMLAENLGIRSVSVPIFALLLSGPLSWAPIC